MWASLGLDGELSQVEQALLRAHVGRCADCAAFASDVGAPDAGAPHDALERPSSHGHAGTPPQLRHARAPARCRRRRGRDRGGPRQPGRLPLFSATRPGSRRRTAAHPRGASRRLALRAAAAAPPRHAPASAARQRIYPSDASVGAGRVAGGSARFRRARAHLPGDPWPTRASNGSNRGSIVEIKGVVLDAVFPHKLPDIYSALSIADRDGELIAEVQQHLGDDRVRAVAMDTTDGLARGTEVVDTGEPISVPVGDQTLGPHLERHRRPRRRQGGGDRRALADPPRPAGIRRAVGQDRDLRDGHQGHRPDRAVRARRQDRALRRRGRRQDGAHPGADPQRREEARRRVGVHRRRRAHPRGHRPLSSRWRSRAFSTRSRWSTAR